MTPRREENQFVRVTLLSCTAWSRWGFPTHASLVLLVNACCPLRILPPTLAFCSILVENQAGWNIGDLMVKTEITKSRNFLFAKEGRLFIYIIYMLGFNFTHLETEAWGSKVIQSRLTGISHGVLNSVLGVNEICGKQMRCESGGRQWFFRKEEKSLRRQDRSEDLTVRQSS